MLPVETVRALAIIAILSMVAGTVVFRRHGCVFGRARGRVIARTPSHPAWYRVWEVLVSAPIGFLLLAAAIPAWVYGTAWNVEFPGDTYLQVVGFVAWGLGGLLVLAAVRALGRFMVVDIAIAEDHALVSQGPYARIRHPAYTAVMLMAYGIALFLLHAGVLAIGVATTAVAVWRALQEEDLLASAPPTAEEYRNYMARTGRFLPRRRRSP